MTSPFNISIIGATWHQLFSDRQSWVCWVWVCLGMVLSGVVWHWVSKTDAEAIGDRIDWENEQALCLFERRRIGAARVRALRRMWLPCQIMQSVEPSRLKNTEIVLLNELLFLGECSAKSLQIRQPVSLVFESRWEAGKPTFELLGPIYKGTRSINCHFDCLVYW